MKTRRCMAGWIGMGLICIVSPSAGFAQTGSITRTVDADGWDLMSVPFFAAPTNKFGVIATNVSVGSRVYFYDSGLTNFSMTTKSLKGWPTTISMKPILPGESFFLHAYTNSGYTMDLHGDVPAGPVTNQVHERWSALGYPFPDETAWTDTALASDLPVGSLVYFWDADLGKFNTFRKGPAAKGGWGAASNHIISPGDGFVVRQPPGSAPFLWIQERSE